jgi:hypothetical protein
MALFEVLSQRLPRGTAEDHEKLRHNIRSLGRNLNPGPPQ